MTHVYMLFFKEVDQQIIGILAYIHFIPSIYTFYTYGVKRFYSRVQPLEGLNAWQCAAVRAQSKTLIKSCD